MSSFPRARLVPEMIQTSAMDCGPVALWSLLAGHGIVTRFDDLREICHTDVDGTSIDAIEELAGRFGLDVEQTIVPAEHLCASDANALPAIVVTAPPAGPLHFVVLWASRFGLVQEMNPEGGRRWVRRGTLEARLYQHTMRVSSAEWREAAGQEEFIGPLSDRMLRTGMPTAEVVVALNAALEDPTWRSLAALDAATRLTQTLCDAGGIRRGRAAGRALRAMHDAARVDGAGAIPAPYWTCGPLEKSGDDAQLPVRGAVLVRVRSRQEHPRAVPGASLAARLDRARARQAPVVVRLLRYLAQEKAGAAVAILGGLLAAALATSTQAVLLQGLIDLGRLLVLPQQRAVALGAVAALAGLLALLEMKTTEGLLALGRRLEARVRVDFIEKLARLPEHFFGSRLTSDLAERLQRASVISHAPELAGRLARVLFELTFVCGGLVWLAPWSAPLVLGVALLAVALPIAFIRLLRERQLSVATYRGGLSRFYFEALRGLLPLLTHGADQALKGEHDRLLGQWAHGRIRLLRTSTLLNAVTQVVSAGFGVLLLVEHLRRHGDVSRVLLLMYWAQLVPALGQEMVNIVSSYPAIDAVASRLLDPLGLAETPRQLTSGVDGSRLRAEVERGLALAFRGVSLSIGGQPILTEVSFELAAGRHCGVVGPSGAGKSSLLGLLLGWQFPTEGHIEIDGHRLGAEGLAALRQQTAWLDPDVHLWNRSLLENLRYGASSDALSRLSAVLGKADLQALVRKLPAGLSTSVGEGGRRLSEGEGQRLRLGRAMLKGDVRLVLMDEPFRGLDRATRRERLDEVRRWWPACTLLCMTHDPHEALELDQVAVVEGGRVVEFGSPGVLSANPNSRFSAQLRAADDVRHLLSDDGVWRRLEMASGRLSSRTGPS